MVKITAELLRKRSEHNDKCLSNLEEIALHQYKIRKIEQIDRLCRRLQILLLQNNKITKIENLILRDLRYLNLALNRITVVENLEACESLAKLDLTANFIYDYKSASLALRSLECLKELYLSGCPCTGQPYYREYMIVTLPQIEILDGIAITRTERIKAGKILSENRPELDALNFSNLANKRPKWEEETDGSDYEENDSETKLRRAADQTALEEIKMKNPKLFAKINREKENNCCVNKNDESINKAGIKGFSKKKCSIDDFIGGETEPERLSDGRIRQFNETQFNFNFEESYKNQELTFCLYLPKFLATEFVQIDVHPTYIKALVKESRLQILLPYEVKCGQENVKAVRITTTGVLKVHIKLDTDINTIPPPQVFPVAPTKTALESTKEHPLEKKKGEEVEQDCCGYNADDECSIPSDLPDLE